MNMAVYLIIDIAVRENAATADYAQYVEKVGPIVEEYGGRYLSRGGAITSVAGDWKPERLILIEFPSSDHAMRWWNSPEYRAIVALREGSTSARAIIAEGCNG